MSLCAILLRTLFAPSPFTSYDFEPSPLPAGHARKSRGRRTSHCACLLNCRPFWTQRRSSFANMRRATLRCAQLRVRIFGSNHGTRRHPLPLLLAGSDRTGNIGRPCVYLGRHDVRTEVRCTGHRVYQHWCIQPCDGRDGNYTTHTHFAHSGRLKNGSMLATRHPR